MEIFSLLQKLLTFDYLADKAGNGGQHKGQVKRKKSSTEKDLKEMSCSFC